MFRSIARFILRNELAADKKVSDYLLRACRRSLHARALDRKMLTLLQEDNAALSLKLDEELNAHEQYRAVFDKWCIELHAEVKGAIASAANEMKRLEKDNHQLHSRLRIVNMDIMELDEQISSLQDCLFIADMTTAVLTEENSNLRDERQGRSRSCNGWNAASRRCEGKP